jgi:hypothetical protein
MLLFLRNFHLAGEWVVGGVEAKGFAYVLVFLALEAMVRDRWRAALLLAGAAGAFHVLVGGWTAVAIGFTWMAVGRSRPALFTLLPAAVGGLILALPGLIPAMAMNWGVPDEVEREASRIYVFERLSHHLVFHEFPVWHQVRYALLLAAWASLAWSMRGDAGQRRLQLVVLGAVAIGLIGLILDQAFVAWAQATGQSPESYQQAVAPLLRYYWFRLSDSFVPVGTALAIVWWIAHLQAKQPKLASWLLLAAIAAAAWNVADVCYRRNQRRLPGAILQPRPAPASQVGAWTADWQAASEWIRANTPPQAKFITPRAQQTFKWYAERAEVANWKDVPQDAQAIVAWKAALDELYPQGAQHRQQDLAAFTDEQLQALARKYGASHIMIDRTRARRLIRLPRVYPEFREDNPSFEVYRVPPTTADAAP